MGSASSSQAQNESRSVKTVYGTVVGRRFVFGSKEVDAFQGIPFAKPPVGDLRFKAFGPRGIQKDALFERCKHGRKSEDNLYLNVFSPAWDPGNSTRFAVLVFIHGGGFISDSCVKYGDERICEHLCTKDVVVVTTQYRLGYLGFFSTGDEHCPGNFALWDQTLALKWVQENIAFFNGDPRNVTVMGQSAGGASVDLLSICPHSRDLFQRVIPMAGNASCEWSTHNNMVEVCRKFAESIGISETHHSLNMINGLREIEASKFALSLMESMSSASDSELCPVAPRIDGDFITKPIEQLRKEAPGKPMLIGCCEAEGLIMLLGRKASVSALMEQISKLVPEWKYPSEFKLLRRDLLRKLINDEDMKNSDLVRRAFVERTSLMRSMKSKQVCANFRSRAVEEMSSQTDGTELVTCQQAHDFPDECCSCYSRAYDYLRVFTLYFSVILFPSLLRFL
ncbi:hypothetical protein RB195_010779 [Necator americanus]|uniref:Carboxylesterase type B domain-containing protein n=1 Tax=Necator americanus TaxID=51031 RepID=A0ABR1D171_NECAM